MASDADSRFLVLCPHLRFVSITYPVLLGRSYFSIHKVVGLRNKIIMLLLPLAQGFVICEVSIVMKSL